MSMEQKKGMAGTRFTTVHDRYHVGHRELGLLETAMTREQAFRVAAKEAQGILDFVTVFDSMATIGKPNHWEVGPNGGVRVIGTRAALQAAPNQAEAP